MTGPVTNPPPSGPGRDEPIVPLDPESLKGREVAARLTRVLAEIELELAAKALAAPVRSAA